jgi:hypothetical protein
MHLNSNFRLISLCAYLTSVDNQWRDVDHVSSKMVKALKGDAIRGYFNYEVGGIIRRFDQSNISEFVTRIAPALARIIVRAHDGLATLVPIPNSHVISPDTGDFKTFDLATKIAAESGGRYSVAPALVFNEVQQKSREGGPRDPKHFEAAYRITRKVEGPIILVDDVCTGGGHLVGAHWRLHKSNSPIVLACTFGKSTRQQLDNPIGVREDLLDLSRI